MEKKIRQEGPEALRILAMLMIISMHYLQKGGVLTDFQEGITPVNAAAWLIETLCIGASNAYVLISSFYLAEGRFRLRKLISLVVQIWIYSVTVPLVCLVFGIGGVRNWNLYDWVGVLLPLQSEHYWFATAYVGFYLFVPLLRLGVKGLDKRQFQWILGGLLLFFCVGKSFWPMALAPDRYGYDTLWFLCLFLIAVYLKQYPLSVLQSAKRGFGIYLAAVLFIWLAGMGLDRLAGMGLPTGYAADMLYSYNHAAVVILSVALVSVFLNLKIQSVRMARAIRFLAAGTFGVYLLHENAAIRHLWQGWFQIEKVRGSLLFLPHMLLTVAAVFLAGTVMDLGRRKAEAGMTQWISRKRRERTE